MTRAWLVLAIVGPMAPAAARSEDPPAFAPPATLDAWEARRAEVRGTVRRLLGGLPERPEPDRVEASAEREQDGYVVRDLTIHSAKLGPISAAFCRPATRADDGPIPGLIYLPRDGGRRSKELFDPGPWGDSPARDLTRRGFAVLAVDAPTEPNAIPWTDAAEVAGLPRWGAILLADGLGVAALARQKEVDRSRLGAVGVGPGGTQALWLTALDDRLAAGVAIGGLTRISDWAKARGDGVALNAWTRAMLREFDAEAIAALIAPRPFSTLYGTDDPSSPGAGVEVLLRTSEKALALSRNPARNKYYHFTYGGVGDEWTPLEWDSALEFLDKPLLPQGPTPLAHTPEPEPAVDDSFLDLAAAGIAGWVPEMSQRPGTWTYRDGVVACAPGRNEYGWIRAPIEVEDFIFQVEWKVPRGGNSGIFLRSRPIFWTIPSSEEGKLLVESLGLEWPSRSGLELQAADGFGPASKYSTGSLYRHAAPSDVPMKPTGEWNRYTVRARGDRMEVWLNGEQIHDTDLSRLVTLRKVPRRGFIGLQNHGNGAEFRNIRLLPLDPSAGP